MEEVIKQIEELVKNVYVNLPGSSVYTQGLKDGVIVASETIIQILKSCEKAKMQEKPKREDLD